MAKIVFILNLEQSILGCVFKLFLFFSADIQNQDQREEDSNKGFYHNDVWSVKSKSENVENENVENDNVNANSKRQQKESGAIIIKFYFL